jgi:hypothetical protein
MWLGPGLDPYASESLFACLMGVILVPLVIPWRHAVQQYARAPAEPWRSPSTARAPQNAA